ncbi:MAG TPA: DUF58 domain-containing protein [Ktedonobacteraceae bacterium]|nr:DUF58 domain-containing protein [Ktedonobacteraceae bacterium]
MNKGWYILGIVIILASLPFHQALLSVIGLLIILVIGVTDIWEKYCLRNLRYARSFSERRALFGERVTLSLSVENAKLLPLPWIEARDMVPRALPIAEQQVSINIFGDSFYLDNMFSSRWYERVTRRYTVLCNARGVHKFGPTTLRSGDVFGFLTREETLNNLQYLLVYPLIVPLTRFSLPARHPFGDRRAPRRLLEDPSRIIGVRDYVYGDSLRRVHWKATARTMQLQSKVYEATTTYTLITFLNVAPHFDAHYGLQTELRELAICAAASVADWAINEGYAVGLYANTLMFMPEAGMKPPTEPESETAQSSGATDVEEQRNARRIHLPPATSEGQRTRIMETLARIQPYHGSNIEDVIQTERSRLPAGATVVVVTSTVSERLLDTLDRVRRAGHAVTILFTGDEPPPTKFAGVTVYHLGGTEMWQRLEKAYSIEGVPDENPVAIPERIPIGLQL